MNWEAIAVITAWAITVLGGVYKFTKQESLLTSAITSLTYVSDSLKTIVEQLRILNGRVRTLEEWKIGHEKWADDVRDRMDKRMENMNR